MNNLKGLLKDNQGQAVVEFALIIPIFILLVFGAFDFGSAMHKKHLLTQLSKEITRYASVTESSSAVTTKQDELISTYFDTETVTVTYNPALSDRDEGKGVIVTAAYTYKPITPGLGLIPEAGLSFESKSQARFEAEKVEP